MDAACTELGFRLVFGDLANLTAFTRPERSRSSRVSAVLELQLLLLWGIATPTFQYFNRLKMKKTPKKYRREDFRALSEVLRKDGITSPGSRVDSSQPVTHASTKMWLWTQTSRSTNTSTISALAGQKLRCVGADGRAGLSAPHRLCCSARRDLLTRA